MKTSCDVLYSAAATAAAVVYWRLVQNNRRTKRSGARSNQSRLLSIYTATTFFCTTFLFLIPPFFPFSSKFSFISFPLFFLLLPSFQFFLFLFFSVDLFPLLFMYTLFHLFRIYAPYLKLSRLQYFFLVHSAAFPLFSLFYIFPSSFSPSRSFIITHRWC